MQTFSKYVGLILTCLLFSSSVFSQKKLVVEGTKGNAFINYRVQAGETMNIICVMFKTDAVSLAAINGLTANAKLPVGKMIKIPFNPQILRQDEKAPNLPTAVVHKVATGENLYRISLGHNYVNMDVLKKWNRLPVDAIVSEGDEIIVGFLPMEGLGSGYVYAPGALNNASKYANNKNITEGIAKEKDVAANNRKPNENNKTELTKEQKTDLAKRSSTFENNNKETSTQRQLDSIADAKNRKAIALENARLNAEKRKRDSIAAVKQTPAEIKVSKPNPDSARRSFGVADNNSVNKPLTSSTNNASKKDSSGAMNMNALKSTSLTEVNVNNSDNSGDYKYLTGYKQIESSDPSVSTRDSIFLNVNVSAQQVIAPKNDELIFYTNLMNAQQKAEPIRTDIKHPEMYVDSANVRPEGFFTEAFGKGTEKMRMLSYVGNAMSFSSETGWRDKKYYILLNEVPPGSVVKVTYAPTGKFIYAKVLWTLDNYKANEGLDYRITDAAASVLGVKETKFPLLVTLYK